MSVQHLAIPDFPPVPATAWDCRWPDPVALQVASLRLLDEAVQRHLEGLNPRIQVTVRLLPPADEPWTCAMLATPWAVEKIYWKAPSCLVESLPVRSAFPLALDEHGRVGAGQGVLLVPSSVPDARAIPVLIAWEPETGHYFVESLRRDVAGYRSAGEALAGVLPAPGPEHAGQAGRSGEQGMDWARVLHNPVSRRSLLTFFR
jgi:hypothetical protein